MGRMTRSFEPMTFTVVFASIWGWIPAALNCHLVLSRASMAFHGIHGNFTARWSYIGGVIWSLVCDTFRCF